jgi:hypothetical protein
MHRKFNLILFLILIGCFLTSSLKAQETTSWYGELNVSSTTLPITLKIEKQIDTTIILMGSPAQTKQMFSVTKQRFTEDSILFTIKSLSVVFRGKYNEAKDTIFATFKQGFLLENLTLVKTQELYEIKRPQEPKPPYPYIEEELSFKVEGLNYQFNGTLTLPAKEGKYPCVILVTGSGMQNRDEEIMGHKPFKLIADYLTRNNIAVFRYDDRGFGAKTIDENIIDATTSDFAIDAQAAFDMLKKHPNINHNNIGMLGHSEGGIVVSMCAAKNKEVKFIILLASSGVKGIDLLVQQNEEIFNKLAMPTYATNMQIAALKKMYALTNKATSNHEIEKQMNNWFDKELSKLDKEQRNNVQFNSEQQRKQFISQLNSRWMREFLNTNPYDYLSKVSQPVFAINGTNDVQVLYQHNLPAIEKALKKAKNKNYKIYTAKGLNHLFQESKTGMIDEYSTIEQTISPFVLELIKDFVLEKTN